MTLKEEILLDQQFVLSGHAFKKHIICKRKKKIWNMHFSWHAQDQVNVLPSKNPSSLHTEIALHEV